MTYREQLKQTHPEWTEKKLEREIKIYCPSFYGLPNPDPCWNVECSECWNLEIPEEKPTYEHSGKPVAKVIEATTDTNGAFARLAAQSKKAAEDFQKAVQAIKDSGDRTEFESGAVRDMREGKGRCDLMPLRVVGAIMQKPIFNELAMFQETGDVNCLYRCLKGFSANWDDKKTKSSPSEIFDQRYSTMFLEVAKHYEEGAKKYGENNWQKGIPTWCYIDSAIRHYLKWLRGDKDEPHDRAFVWNIMCCIWEVDYRDKNKEE